MSPEGVFFSTLNLLVSDVFFNLYSPLSGGNYAYLSPVSI